MQGYLFSKKNELMDYWRLLISDDLWEPNFYVLTNVGLLVFKDENFINPLKLIPLVNLRIVPVTNKVNNRDFLFKLRTVSGEEMLLAAPDKNQFDQW